MPADPRQGPTLPPPHSAPGVCTHCKQDRSSWQAGPPISRGSRASPPPFLHLKEVEEVESSLPGKCTHPGGRGRGEGEWGSLSQSGPGLW